MIWPACNPAHPLPHPLFSVCVPLSPWPHRGRRRAPSAVAAAWARALARAAFLRGACKSGKFLPQLVPAVSIPGVSSVRALVCGVGRGVDRRRGTLLPPPPVGLASDVGAECPPWPIKEQLPFEMMGGLSEYYSNTRTDLAVLAAPCL